MIVEAVRTQCKPLSYGPDISPNIHQTFVGPNCGQFCVFLEEHVTRYRHFADIQIAWVLQSSLVLKAFKGFILHIAHAHARLLSCDPVRQTRQKPDTLRTRWVNVGTMFVWNQISPDIVPAQKNEQTTLSDGHVKLSNIWPTKCRVNVGRNVKTVRQELK